MDNKVMASRQVARPADEIVRNPTARPNPTERGMNAPAVPPVQIYSGENDSGNGTGASMPLRK